MRRLTCNGGEAVLSGLDHIPDLGTGVLMRMYAPYGSQNRPLSLISGMGILGARVTHMLFFPLRPLLFKVLSSHAITIDYYLSLWSEAGTGTATLKIQQ